MIWPPMLTSFPALLILLAHSGIIVGVVGDRRVACENDAAVLDCGGRGVIDLVSARYGRTDGSTCGGPVRTTNCGSPHSLTIITTACQGTQQCSVKASNDVFGDPCVGTKKYLDVHYNCKPADVIKKIACENDNLYLGCGPNSVVEAVSANYGRSTAAVCNRNPIRTNSCSAPHTLSAVRSICDDRRECYIPATNDVFGDPCIGTVKYLEVSYRCKQSNKERRLSCENDNLSLSCPNGYSMTVVSSNYGRTTNGVCRSGPRSTTNCRSNSLPILQAVCNGAQVCTIKGSNAIFGDPCVGTVKYLEATYTCEKAEKTRSKVCENDRVDLHCPSGTTLEFLKANYGRTEGATCPRQPIKTTWCTQPNTLATLQAVCQDMERCQVSASNRVFGDPCVGTVKYLDFEYKCRHSNVRRGHACEGNSINLNCAPGHRLQIVRANYGRTDSNTCPNGPIYTSLCYAANSLNIVRSSCHDKQQCSIPAANSIFGDPCHGTHKYLDITYKCNVVPPPTTTPPTTTTTTTPTTTTTTTTTTPPPTTTIPPATTTTPPPPVTVPTTTTTPKPKPAHYIIRGCENQTIEIKCEKGYIHINWNWYGRIKSKGDQCSRKNSDMDLCYMPESSELLREKCEGSKTCTVDVDSMKLAEPCEFDDLIPKIYSKLYMEANYSCSEKKSHNYGDLIRKVVCEDEMVELECSDGGSHIGVMAAKYSAANISNCPPSPSTSVCQSLDTLDRLAPRCNGKTRCAMKVNEENFGESCSNSHLDISYKCYKAPTRVRDLFVYKKGDQMVSLAWSSPLFTHGIVTDYRVAVRGTDKSYVHKPAPCIPWPTMYCFTVTNLEPETNYTFEVSAKNDKNYDFGDVSAITAETVEHAPEAPVGLSVTRVTDSSIRLKWKPPRRANGILRSFILKVDQISSYDPQQCCQRFPMKEVQVTEEEAEYTTEVTVLVSGSTYAVSVTGSTTWLGPAAMVRAVTRPPKPSDIPLPQVQLNTEQPIEWRPTSVPWPGNYTSLIRCNLLLLVTDQIEEKDFLDEISVRFGGEEYDSDEVTDLQDDVASLTSLIKNEMDGGNFQVLAQYKAGDEILVGKDRGGPVATHCGLTADSNVDLKSGQKYRMAAIQVIQYKGLYNVAAKLTKPFVMS